MDFTVPELGEGVHEGELTKWRVAVGDAVKFDQPVCEIMTDKATVELPSPFEGKITSLNAKEGEMIKVGQAIASYAGAGATASSGAAHHAPTPAPHASSAPAPVAASASAPVTKAAPAVSSGAGIAAGELSPEKRALAAPATRKLARELGIDLGRVQGSGPHGRVMKEDLERSGRGGGSGATSAGGPVGVYIPKDGPARTPAPAGGEERVPFKGLRKKISEKMRQSKDHAAHFTYVEEADATALVELRNQAKEIGTAQGVKVTYLPFVMKAMVAALKQFPILNSSLDEEKGEIVIKHYYNIGLSVQTDDGLTAPVVKNVDQKSVIEIAREIQQLVDKARAKKLTMDDLHGGSITLTNAGSIGGLFATPVINYPEVAILGFNKIFRKPVVRTVGGREEIAIRDWTYFSISLDHRIVDGAVGAEFMKLFIRYIENPALLVLNSL